MTGIEALQARIDTLESRVAFQDETIEDLNKVVTEQWTQIDRLTRQVAALLDRIEDIEHARSLGAPQEAPPPHY